MDGLDDARDRRADGKLLETAFDCGQGRLRGGDGGAGFLDLLHAIASLGQCKCCFCFGHLRACRVDLFLSGAFLQQREFLTSHRQRRLRDTQGGHGTVEHLGALHASLVQLPGTRLLGGGEVLLRLGELDPRSPGGQLLISRAAHELLEAGGQLVAARSGLSQFFRTKPGFLARELGACAGEPRRCAGTLLEQVEWFQLQERPPQRRRGRLPRRGRP